MIKKSKFLTASLSLLLGVSLITPSTTKDVSIKENAYKQLMSFDNSTLETDEEKNITYFSFEDDSCYGTEISSSNNIKMLREVPTTRTKIKATSYNSIGLQEYEVTRIENDKEILQTTIYGFPSKNENGETNVILDVFGDKIIANDSELTKIGTDIRIGGPNQITPYIDSVVKASINLQNYTDAETFASKLVVIPDKPTLENIWDYIFYRFKLEIIKENYLSNISKETEVEKYLVNNGGWINNQFDKSLRDLKFSIYGNIENMGCEIVAVYNALHDCGYNVGFASLISLFELSNVDLGCGYFGSSPIQKEYSKEVLYDYFMSIFLVIYNQH